MEEVGGKYLIKCPVTSEQLLQITKTALIKESANKSKISDSKTAINYLIPYFNGQENEIFVALFLDNLNKLIEVETLDVGTINRVNVYPRKLIKAILKHNASGVIISHNHPSGDLTASEDDIKLTNTLKPLLGAIDVVLIDHIIVSNGNANSLASENLI